MADPRAITGALLAGLGAYRGFEDEKERRKREDEERERRADLEERALTLRELEQYVTNVRNRNTTKRAFRDQQRDLRRAARERGRAFRDVDRQGEAAAREAAELKSAADYYRSRYTLPTTLPDAEVIRIGRERESWGRPTSGGSRKEAPSVEQQIVDRAKELQEDERRDRGVAKPLRYYLNRARQAVESEMEARADLAGEIEKADREIRYKAPVTAEAMVVPPPPGQSAAPPAPRNPSWVTPGNTPPPSIGTGAPATRQPAAVQPERPGRAVGGGAPADSGLAPTQAARALDAVLTRMSPQQRQWIEEAARAIVSGEREISPDTPQHIRDIIMAMVQRLRQGQ